MIFSEQLMLSDQQAITATAIGTAIIDFGKRDTQPATGDKEDVDMGAGCKHDLAIVVTEDFATCTSVQVVLEGSDTANAGGDELTSSAIVLDSAVIPVATLKTGYRFNLDNIPSLSKYRYMGIKYVVAGTNASAGKITAGIVAANHAG